MSIESDLNSFSNYENLSQDNFFVVRKSLDYITQQYGISKEHMVISSGAAVSILLKHYSLRRPITDVDILLNPQMSSLPESINSLTRFELDSDLRSVPWGLVYLNPIVTINQIPGLPQMDLLVYMLHAHWPGNSEDPLSGLIYRFPVEEVFEKHFTEIDGIKVMSPELIILYKLLQWRNGDYPGWDRRKVDAKDIYYLLTCRIASYDGIINAITEYANDETLKKVLINRIDSISNQYFDSFGQQQPDVLVPKRIWGKPEISFEIKENFWAFLKSGERLRWLKD